MQSVTKGDCTTCIPAAAGNGDQGFPARSPTAPWAWPHSTGSLAVPGWDGKHPLHVALCRSTCTGAPGCTRGMHLGVTVLPSGEADMVPTGAAEERELWTAEPRAGLMLVHVS